MRWRPSRTPEPRRRASPPGATAGSSGPVGIGLFHLSVTDVLDADPRNAGGVLDQIGREAAGFSSHDRSSSQSETQRIRLVLEVEHDLSRHNTSPGGRKRAAQKKSGATKGASWTGFLVACLPPIV